jgi:glycosyltransferase involved in cell wall biosynthesis
MRLTAAMQAEQNRYLFVGQLEKHKGIEWLIDFWRVNNISAELIVVGDGTLKFTALPANVKLLGKKVGDELNTFFAQADFLIVPSLCYENSPTVIPLAFQDATPVIVANIGLPAQAGGAGELVKSGETGFLFEAGDANSFKSTLNAAMALPDAEYARVSQNCLTRASDFALEKYVDKIALL